MGVVKLLDAAVADQIAAGEVVEKPASAVKELMENAVDAGAKNISLVLQNAGQTLLQVIDDGCGMSPEDAVSAFQRHATSKIASADDLYKLTTFGFRGEALPSIASVSQVEMRTRREQDDLGVEVVIAASVVQSQKEVQCPVGTSITVRNIFFNIPARRKFLKSATYERTMIITEFEKIAMANPDITFTLKNEADPPITYRAASLRQRVSDIVKKNVDKALLSVELTTPHFTLKGWVTSPQQSGVNSTKNSHFFVNGRFMRNMSLQKAVAQAYGRLLPQGQYPYFYLFIDIQPSAIDVNIHPTKDKIKFEDEQLVWQMINSAVRKTLGSASLAPSLDFANPVRVDIPTYRPLSDRDIVMPRTTSGGAKGGASYNPFSQGYTGATKMDIWAPAREFDPEMVPFTEQLPPGLLDDGQIDLDAVQSNASHDYEEMPSMAITGKMELGVETLWPAFQMSPRYVVTAVGGALVVVDYPRAMGRIAYERLYGTIQNGCEPSQLELIPENIELTTGEVALLMDVVDDLSSLGFEVADLGGGHLAVYAIPASLCGKIDVATTMRELAELLEDSPTAARETMLSAIARSSSRVTPRMLQPEEIQTLLRDLMACDEPNHTPDSLPIITSISTDEIDKRLRKR